MLHCDTVKQMLSNYLEDSIDPDLKSQIKAHLEACPACKIVAVQVQNITKRLHAITAVKTSPNFDQRLRTQIISDRPTEKPVITVRNLSYGLSGLAVIVGVYFITTTNMMSFDKDQAVPAQGQTISNSKPVQSMPAIAQPVNAQSDILAADTVKSSPTNLEDRDIQLIDKR